MLFVLVYVSVDAEMARLSRILGVMREITWIALWERFYPTIGPGRFRVQFRPLALVECKWNGSGLYC